MRPLSTTYSKSSRKMPVILSGVWGVICRQKSSQKMLEELLFPTAFQKSTCKETASSHGYLGYWGATRFMGLTFRSLEGLPLILPTHDLTPGCGMQALLFLIFKSHLTLYFFAAYKISYFIVTDLLGRWCFSLRHCLLCIYMLVWVFFLFLFLWPPEFW